MAPAGRWQRSEKPSQCQTNQSPTWNLANSETKPHPWLHLRSVEVSEKLFGRIKTLTLRIARRPMLQQTGVWNLQYCIRQAAAETLLTTTEKLENGEHCPSARWPIKGPDPFWRVGDLKSVGRH